MGRPHSGKRSPLKISSSDLARLSMIAAADRVAFVSRSSGGRLRLLRRYRCAALCQGAALHFVDGRNGIKDFDVWSFYEGAANVFPPRRTVSVDFGLPKFGRSPDKPDFVGRRVDLLGRGLRFRATKGHPDIVRTLQTYLQAGVTKSARRLREKAVVLVDPPALRGRVVWPMPVEDMLSVLAECGIRRRRGITVGEVVDADCGGPLEDERPTWYELLSRLGFERAKPPHEALSDNIELLDAKCVYDSDAYTPIVRRLARLTRGRLPLERVRSRLDFSTGVGDLSFRLAGRDYQWPIQIDRKWLDESILDRLAELLNRRDRHLRFVDFGLGDQYLLLGCMTAAEARRLKQQAGVAVAPLGGWER